MKLYMCRAAGCAAVPMKLQCNVADFQKCGRKIGLRRRSDPAGKGKPLRGRRPAAPLGGDATGTAVRRLLRLVAGCFGRVFALGFRATVLFQVGQGPFDVMARGPVPRSLLLQLRHSLLALFRRQRATRGAGGNRRADWPDLESRP